MNLDYVDRELFRELEDLHDDLKSVLLELLKKEKKLQDSRGKKKYRDEVIKWMKANLNNSGEWYKKNGQGYFTVEFEYTKANKKRKRTFYPKEEVKLPEKIMKMAFLSGKDSRMIETNKKDEWINPDDIADTKPGFKHVLYNSDNVGGIQVLFDL